MLALVCGIAYRIIYSGPLPTSSPQRLDLSHTISSTPPPQRRRERRFGRAATSPDLLERPGALWCWVILIALGAGIASSGDSDGLCICFGRLPICFQPEVRSRWSREGSAWLLLQVPVSQFILMRDVPNMLRSGRLIRDSVRSNTGRTHLCTLCNRTFARAEHLRRHQLSRATLPSPDCFRDFR